MLNNIEMASIKEDHFVEALCCHGRQFSSILSVSCYLAIIPISSAPFQRASFILD